jgi:hypothetical protein
VPPLLSWKVFQMCLFRLSIKSRSGRGFTLPVPKGVPGREKALQRNDILKENRGRQAHFKMIRSLQILCCQFKTELGIHLKITVLLSCSNRDVYDLFDKLTAQPQIWSRLPRLPGRESRTDFAVTH